MCPFQKFFTEFYIAMQELRLILQKRALKLHENKVKEVLFPDNKGKFVDRYSVMALLNPCSFPLSIIHTMLRVRNTGTSSESLQNKTMIIILLSVISMVIKYYDNSSELTRITHLCRRFGSTFDLKHNEDND